MKKVFVLGAGTSRDFGFPSGIELMKEIHSSWEHPDEIAINNYVNIMEKLKKEFRSHPNRIAVEKIKKLSYRFYLSGADSDFLSQCKDEVDLQFGRLTILNAILKKEQKTKQFGDGTLFKWEENWLRVLFGEEFRFENVEQLKKKLETEQFYFVIFNYDRCVEHFLYTAIQNYYDLKGEDTKDIINKMRFYHVYGQLAPLEWQPEGNPIRFGDAFEGVFDDLYRFVPNIKIVNEDRGDVEDIRHKIGAQIRDAGKVYILGFGFQDPNWKLLGIDEYKKHRANGLPWSAGKFHYTNFGLSKRRREHIRGKLFGLISNGTDSARSYDSTVYEFMHHDYT
ncbi:MAG: hypothetical protein HZC18_06945 [Candidatus Omnitrophica bacterium]|nr:hypothetical protein [Candidatus Omnitrophota bacterium]